MKLYEKIIDGVMHCKPASRIVLIKDGMQIFNPTEEMLLDKFEGTDLLVIKTSTKENSGIDVFEHAIKDMFFNGDIKINDEVMLTNMRQKDAVKDALDSLLMVKRSLEDNMPEDFLSIDLMGAYSSLGFVIGEEIGEDVVNEIFSKFCMGK